MAVDTQAVWEEFGERLRRFIRKRVGDEASAEDILQESFLKIHQGLPGLRQQGKLTSWVFQITRNAIIDHYRRRRPESELSGAATLVYDNPEADSVAEDLVSCLGPMIEQLPEGQRRALVLADLQGLTQGQVATRLGISLSGAKSRVQRARGRLREMLLECCHFEFDRLGGVIDYQSRPAACPSCAARPLGRP